MLPADTRIRFVITADDVIHAWWVPALGWKQDAIPGVINEAWTQVAKPGTYRGVCAELCGKDHGFMPIVVKVRAEGRIPDLAGRAAEGRATPSPRPPRPTDPRCRAAEPATGCIAATPAPHCCTPFESNILQKASDMANYDRRRTTQPTTTTTMATSRASSSAGSTPPTTRTSVRCT